VDPVPDPLLFGEAITIHHTSTDRYSLEILIVVCAENTPYTVNYALPS
jgi:hypothetical protein